MKLTTPFTTLLTTSTILASPLPRRCIQIEAIYTIDSFTTRKHDGQTIDTVSFNIASTNSEVPDTTCTAYDSSLGQATGNFEIGRVYLCGENSPFSFSYTPNSDPNMDELVLWQEIDDLEKWVGSTTPPDGICRAGGDGVNDLICVVPEMGGVDVEMEMDTFQV